MISNVYRVFCSFLCDINNGVLVRNNRQRHNAFSMCAALLMLMAFSTAAKAATDYKTVMDNLIQLGDEANESYDPDQPVQSGGRFSALYFGGFESKGLEFAVGQADQQAMLEIEMSFSRLINKAVNGAPAEEVNKHWQSLRVKLVNAPMLDSQNASFWSTVVQSLFILLREGVEALLVIAALVAYLRKSGAADKVRYIWLGVIVALMASVVTAWVLQVLIANSGAAKETLEGTTMLLAAVLLGYVSFWLFSRREIQQWQSFIHHKMGGAVSSGSLWAIVLVAFFAVYREGAETILFYQALIVDVEGSLEPIATGFALALGCLCLVYVFIFQLSIRLPLKQFFSGTAALLYLLSIVFAGKSVLELQVAGWLSNTHLESFPTVSWLGIFPSVEAIAMQLLFLLLPVVVYVAVAMGKASPEKADAAFESRTQ